MRAELYLVNYAKAGTRCADEILLMQVHNVTDKEVSTTDFRMSRRAFQAWFRYQNARCLDDGAHPEPPTFLFARGGYLHRSARCPYLKGKRDMQLLLEDEVSPHALRPCKTCWEAGR